MGPADLEDILSSLQAPAPSGKVPILVGPGDDAGVYLLDSLAVIETVDVITPVVDDPFTFGAISANNSLSDVYAMGGTPVSSLAIVGFPTCDYEPVVMKEVLRGAVDTLNRAGAFLIGGHSFDDPELKFGLSVTGVAQRDKVLRVSGAQEGEAIVLTKPLGIGILTTALKGRKLAQKEISYAVEWMLTLNEAASRIALEANASACTDVTGFGLLGHAFTMVKGSSIDFVIRKESVPVLDRVHEMIKAGMIPGGAYNNLRFLKGKVSFSPSVREDEQIVLADPQTSGGLLITMREDRVELFKKAHIFHRVIGRVVKGSGRILVE